ncbi:MAG: radical SAM/SPASM domain-containing protein [Campylobacterota bacterium]|nr:radical SAM/SPASM domain-containing protein [Campylobacterota bacterium]
MHFKFHKVYIELTNICGLRCSFCPTKTTKSQTISLEFFEKIIKQVSLYTNDIALHVFGDPLTLKNLEDYLDILFKYNLKTHITTTGYYLNNFDLNTFLHKSIKQINFSINSYNKNEMDITLDEYLNPIFKLCDLKLRNNINSFINFRLWNIDKQNSEYSFNQMVLDNLSNKFDINLKNISYEKSIRLDKKILIDFDRYFKWPSLDDDVKTDGFCYGLSSQIAILSDGTVVPCCLDSFGCIDLGNLYNTTLEDILKSEKVSSIVEGFKNKIAVEELCQKCTYKNRFNRECS